MKKLEFRKLKADEIECRVGTEDRSQHSWCTLLLYKDARVDMRLLDEVVGSLNWQRHHEIRQNVINGVQTMCNYCRVSIYNEETNQWVEKEDIGTESNTENAKGEASDAFKRACFNWGIGRELYSAPFILVRLTQDDLNKSQKLTQVFSVKKIGYDDDGNITYLVIVDKHGKVRFSFGDASNFEPLQDAAKVKGDVHANVAQYETALNALLGIVHTCNTKEDLMSLKNNNPSFANDSRFRDALNARYQEIKQSA